MLSPSRSGDRSVCARASWMTNCSGWTSTRATWVLMRLRSSIGADWFEMLPNRSYDQRLDLGCRHPAYRSGALRLALEQGGREIVSVLDAAACGRGSGVMRLPRSSKMRPVNKASDFILAVL